MNINDIIEGLATGIVLLLGIYCWVYMIFRAAARGWKSGMGDTEITHLHYKDIEL